MSSLTPSDRHLHHRDTSHRWSGGPPDPAGQEAYQEALRAHMEEHQRQAYAPRRPAARQTAVRRTT